MATLSFSVQYDMSTATAWNGTVTAHDKSSLTIESLPLKATYTSSGGSLKYKNGSAIPSSGTISGVKEWDNDVLQYELSGGKLSIAKILGYLNALDVTGLQQYELSGNDRITGSLAADVLLGWAGNDVLDGGKDADSLQGGKGNDTYAVDNVGDVIVELADEGTDLAESSQDYTLSGNVENLTLLGVAVNGTGNALKNKLIGNDSANVLDGGGDKDSLSGGKGNDTYIVDLIKRGSSAALEDKITEKSAEITEIDTVKLRAAGDLAISKAATLKLGANLENMDASGTGNNLLNLTGNSLDNILTGNAAANILDGGKGKDTLEGGAGADTYIIDDTEDTVTEVAAADIDLVKIKISSSGSYTLGEYLENATLTSSVAFDVIGNALDNAIIGNKKNNLIEGNGGADNLDGGAGDDTVSYADSAAGVTVTLNGKIPTTGSGGDAEGDTLVNFENITGSALADSLTGDAKANRLDGGAGIDTLTGGDGNDTYVVDVIGDVIVEGNSKTAGNNDTVESWFDYSLGDNIENLTLSNDPDIVDKNFNATGNALDNTILGNDGNNTLDGGEGKDSLKGGNGNDTYIAELIKSGNSASIQDNFVEKAGEGNDSLVLHAVGDLGLTGTATLSLDANIEIMDASDTGSNKLNLTGNAEDNTLTGNAADNVIDGGTGADSMIGGAGADTFIVDDADDTITENTSADIDQVKVDITASGATYILGNNVENAIAISKVDVNLTGNELSNTLTGNSKNNTIEGGGAADTLDGGDGVDTVSYEDSALGVTVELKGSTIATGVGGDAEGDKFKNFENIIGSANNDTLTGDANANILDGGAGVDHLTGGNGNDTYIVDSTLDVVTETNDLAAGGIDLVQSAVNFILEANLENLTLTGTAASGTGNELDNILIGNGNVNQLDGGLGNDTLDGGVGIDILTGGKGNDTYYVDLILSGSNQVILEDSITENNAEGTDSLMIYNGRNVSISSTVLLTVGDNLENLDASHTDITLLNLKGNALNNVLTGNSSDNSIDGAAGNDTLNGGAGADILIGGAGTDILTGGAGQDTLTGGLDADIFNFDRAASASDADHITDFSGFGINGDAITLLQSKFQNAGTAGKKLASSEFYSGTLPSATATQHILYDTSTGSLYYNEDGVGSAAGLVLIGVFDNKPTLSATDISLI